MRVTQFRTKPRSRFVSSDLHFGVLADPRCGPRTTGIASNTRLNSWITAVIYHETRTIHSLNTFHAPSSAGMPGVDAPAPGDGSAQGTAPPAGDGSRGARQCLRPEKFGFCRPTGWRPKYDEAEAEIERRREALGLPTIDWAPDAPDAAQSLAALCKPTSARGGRRLALFDELDAQRRTGDLRTCRARQDHRRSPAAESPSSRTTPAAARPHESQADG